MTPWTVACQSPPSMGFLRQEFWSGLPFPSPRDLPDPGIKAASPALAGGFFTTESLGLPLKNRIGLLLLLLLSCSVVSNSVQPHGWQPTRLPHPWDYPGNNTGAGCHFLFQCMKVKSESEIAQSFPTLRDPMDCSPPGSPIPGILQATTLEWVTISLSNA